ncbi:putative beta-lysine N-acetyltransferase [Bacillus sp. FJAT-47783]|uniref:putative beta-lysine N-acetyltransferase n=1 Tax=Bacillus sp. FJAT-47783 TaxID=2922712 RepID=UPI001FAE33C2|nr:putative beta-lysine N-acetyltransferase [Bacillus sp. FJAT-47783]
MNKTYSQVKTFQTNKYEATVTFDYYNERCRIDDYRGNAEWMIRDILSYIQNGSFNKVIMKARKRDIPSFLAHLFVVEAVVDQYFQGDDMFFMCRYLSNNRKNSDSILDEDEMIESIYARPKSKALANHDKAITIRKGNEHDAYALSQLYQQTFTVYPTPLHDAHYIVKTMEEGTVYFLAESGNALMSAASAEVNNTYYNAEITDCATLPQYRKLKLMNSIIQNLEEELKKSGIYCSYSIARAQSYGMNAVLHQLDYQYRGRLINNCYISKSIENMNVWCKDLSCN